MLKNNNLLALFFLSLVLTQPLCAIFGIGKKDDDESLQTQKTESPFQVPTFSQEELLDMYFELMARQEKKPIPDFYYLEDSFPTPQDDAVHTGPISRDQLMQALQHTTTIFGHATLVYTLENLANENALLAKREAFIQELTNNKALFKKIETILKRIKKAQAGFFSFFAAEKAEMSDAISSIHWAKLPDAFKKNPLGAHATLYARHLTTLYDSTHILQGYALGAGLRALWEKVWHSRNFWHQFKLHLIDHTTGTWASIKQIQDPTVYAYVCMGLGALAFRQGYDIIKGIGKTHKLYTAITNAQKRCGAAGRILSACSSLHTLATQHKPMADGLSLLTNLQNPPSSGNFARLLALLKTKTFKGSASFFSFSGRILATYHLMREEKDRFAPTLAALGEIDACLALAKLNLLGLVGDKKE